MTITATTTSTSRSSGSLSSKDASTSRSTTHFHHDVDNYHSESKVGANAVCKNVASASWSNVWNAQHRRHDHLISSLRNVISTGPYRAVAPIAIIGGTASVYSSALRQTSEDAFTPLSMMYLLLLALNYALMPRLSRRYIHPSTDKQSVALAEEVVKMTLGLGGWILATRAEACAAVASSSLSGSTNEFISFGVDSTNNVISAATTTTTTTTVSILLKQLEQWSPFSTLVAAGVPSVLYALQGTLTYTAYQNLDAVTFNGLTQFKVLSSALFCYLLLGKGQSVKQMVALGMLMFSTVVFQGSWKEWFVTWKKDNHEKTNAAQSISKTSKYFNHEIRQTQYNRNRRHKFFFGVLPCLGATLLSGLAGALSQRSLQTQVASMERSAYFYTVEISFLSAVCLGISMCMNWSWQQRHNSSNEKPDSLVSEKRNHLFHHWTVGTLLPITTKATAGLLTALVHRHLGSVIKGFALTLGLVFSALLQFIFEDKELTSGQMVGTSLVLFSSWLHFTNPSN
mmetsp:Transcript_1366/g.2863  ORF Transcript_1366/g.2863 Transcript_1366/m.2863 type:complete len:512 (-) Transcript_1366:192-1727(-)